MARRDQPQKKSLTGDFDNVSPPQKNAETFTQYSATENLLQTGTASFQFRRLPLDIQVKIIHAPNLPVRAAFQLTWMANKAMATEIMASDVMNSASIHNEEKDFYRDAMTKRVTRYQEGKDIAHSYHDIANNGNKEAFIKYYTDNKVNESEYFSEYPDIDPELALVSPTVIGPLGLALTNKAVQHLVDGNILPMSELKKMNPAQQMAIANAWVTGHINNHTFTFDQVINAHIDVLQALVTEEGQRFIDKNLEILTNKQHFPDGMLAVADLIKVTSNHENGGWQMSYSSGESTSSTQSTNRTLHINSRVKELCLGQNNQSPSTNETMPEEKENCAIQ